MVGLHTCRKFRSVEILGRLENLPYTKMKSDLNQSKKLMDTIQQDENYDCSDLTPILIILSILSKSEWS